MFKNNQSHEVVIRMVNISKEIFVVLKNSTVRIAETECKLFDRPDPISNREYDEISKNKKSYKKNYRSCMSNSTIESIIITLKVEHLNKNKELLRNIADKLSHLSKGAFTILWLIFQKCELCLHSLLAM